MNEIIMQDAPKKFMQVKKICKKGRPFSNYGVRLFNSERKTANYTYKYIRFSIDHSIAEKIDLKIGERVEICYSADIAKSSPRFVLILRKTGDDFGYLTKGYLGGKLSFSIFYNSYSTEEIYIAPVFKNVGRKYFDPEFYIQFDEEKKQNSLFLVLE
jgi:hypothetical protein